MAQAVYADLIATLYRFLRVINALALLALPGHAETVLQGADQRRGTL